MGSYRPDFMLPVILERIDPEYRIVLYQPNGNTLNIASGVNQQFTRGQVTEIVKAAHLISMNLNLAGYEVTLLSLGVAPGSPSKYLQINLFAGVAGIRDVWGSSWSEFESATGVDIGIAVELDIVPRFAFASGDRTSHGLELPRLTSNVSYERRDPSAPLSQDGATIALVTDRLPATTNQTIAIVRTLLREANAHLVEDLADHVDTSGDMSPGLMRILDPDQWAYPGSVGLPNRNRLRSAAQHVWQGIMDPSSADDPNGWDIRNFLKKANTQRLMQSAQGGLRPVDPVTTNELVDSLYANDTKIDHATVVAPLQRAARGRFLEFGLRNRRVENELRQLGKRPWVEVLMELHDLSIIDAFPSLVAPPQPEFTKLDITGFYELAAPDGDPPDESSGYDTLQINQAGTYMEAYWQTKEDGSDADGATSGNGEGNTGLGSISISNDGFFRRFLCGNLTGHSDADLTVAYELEVHMVEYGMSIDTCTLNASVDTYGDVVAVIALPDGTVRHFVRVSERAYLSSELIAATETVGNSVVGTTPSSSPGQVVTAQTPLHATLQATQRAPIHSVRQDDLVEALHSLLYEEYAFDELSTNYYYSNVDAYTRAVNLNITGADETKANVARAVDDRFGADVASFGTFDDSSGGSLAFVSAQGPLLKDIARSILYGSPRYTDQLGGETGWDFVQELVNAHPAETPKLQAFFGISATANPIHYQWQMTTAGVSGSMIVGMTGMLCTMKITKLTSPGWQAHYGGFWFGVSFGLGGGLVLGEVPDPSDIHSNEEWSQSDFSGMIDNVGFSLGVSAFDLENYIPNSVTAILGDDHSGYGAGIFRFIGDRTKAAIVGRSDGLVDVKGWSAGVDVGYNLGFIWHIPSLNSFEEIPDGFDIAGSMPNVSGLDPQNLLRIQTDVGDGADENLYFTFDKSILTPNARTSIRRMCARHRALFQSNMSELRIDGYTDTAGDVQYNDALSWARARAAYQGISDVLGNGLAIPRSRTSINGYGEDAALADIGDDTKAWQWRMVDIRNNGSLMLKLGAPLEQP